MDVYDAAVAMRVGLLDQLTAAYFAKLVDKVGIAGCQGRVDGEPAPLAPRLCRETKLANPFFWEREPLPYVDPDEASAEMVAMHGVGKDSTSTSTCSERDELAEIQEEEPGGGAGAAASDGVDVGAAKESSGPNDDLLPVDIVGLPTYSPCLVLDVEDMLPSKADIVAMLMEALKDTRLTAKEGLHVTASFAVDVALYL